MNLNVKFKLKRFKQKFLFYSKRLPIVFTFIFISLLLIHSVSSIFTPIGLESFSRAVNQNVDSLIEKRLIFGLKGDLAQKNADQSEIKIVNKGLVSYDVGLNNLNSSFLVDSKTITPIESNLLRYYWSKQPDSNYVTQWVRYSKYDNTFNFDEGDSVIVPKSYFDSHVSKVVQVYSSHLKSFVDFQIVGFFDDTNSDKQGKRLSHIFAETYDNPFFFNHSSFQKLFDGKKDYYINAQNDYIIDVTENYKFGIESIFNRSNYSDNLVIYDNFNHIFNSMNNISIKNVSTHVLVGILSLLILFMDLVILMNANKTNPDISFKELVKATNPFTWIILWSLSAIIMFGLGKILNYSGLFFQPSFGITMTIVVIVSFIYIVFYYHTCAKEKEDKNVAKN